MTAKRSSSSARKRKPRIAHEEDGGLAIAKVSRKISGGLPGSSGFKGVELLHKKKISAGSIIKEFGLSKAQLADTTGLSAETLYRPERAASPNVQARLREMLEIVKRVAPRAGGKDQAMAWYRAQPIPAFGGRTAESLVKEGRAGDVRDYLDHVALGGFA